MTKPNSNLPEWLKQTQNNSWEPEVFISGIVLFGLLQVPELLESFRFYIRREIFGFGDVDTLLAVLMTSVEWLIFGLILHLFFRGIWIGLVGLSYVFPKGIKNEFLNYKGRFKNRVKTIPDFTDQIVQLEKISSSIFSISYFIFMSVLGAYIYTFISLIIPIYTANFITNINFANYDQHPIYVQVLNIYFYCILGIGLVYLFDFLTLGLLKKNRVIANIYYPIYKFVSALTLSVLYRNIYYILISNFKKWKVIVFIIAFIATTVFLIGVNADRDSLSKQFTKLELYGTSSNYSIQNDAYNNLNPNSKYQAASIQSDIINGNVVKLFLTHFSIYEDSIKVLCGYKALDTHAKRDSLSLECMKAFYLVKIDDSLYTDIQWFFHYNGQTAHRGIISYLDISHLKKGMHKIDIDLKNYLNENYDVVQFYKE